MGTTSDHLNEGRSMEKQTLQRGKVGPMAVTETQLTPPDHQVLQRFHRGKPHAAKCSGAQCLHLYCQPKFQIH